MLARDVMTTDVVTAEPGTKVGEIAALMQERRVSGIPVVDGGRLVGIVSEGDLIRREEIGTGERPRSWWLRLLTDSDAADDYVKSHARRAADVMTRDLVTVTEDTPLSEIARLFETRHIKRVPVVRDGALVGIVSRANLIQAVAARSAAAAAAETADDATIRASLLDELERHPWWSGSTSNVIVTDGVVHLWGFYHDRPEVEATRVAAENVPGVHEVQDHRSLYPVAYGSL